MSQVDECCTLQRVSPECIAKVWFQGRLTQQAVEKLVAYLSLMKDTLPIDARQEVA